MKKTGLFFSTLLLLGGCATGRDEPLPESAVDLTAPDGRVLARARATTTTGGVRLFVEAAGLTPGTYAVHVHQAGSCGGEAFADAGPHWNPAGREHGAHNPAGPHFGDLPNLVVAADGQGTIGFVIRGATLTGPENAMLDADGASVVVHANPDDYRTDPSGNSGGRIGCGVLPTPGAAASAPPPADSHTGH